jgi:hypothetical protein
MVAMRRPLKSSSIKLSAESQRLVTYSQALVQAASRLEERNWEHLLDTQIQKLLKGNHQDAIDAALDELFKQQTAAYDALMESLEAGSESCRIEHEGANYDVQLIALPILAWTRFSIPSGAIPADMVTTLTAHLHAHLLADGVRAVLAPTLYSIDQLPRSHGETLALTQKLAQVVLKGTPIKPVTNAPETAPFLADTRYLLAALVTPAGAGLFHWQDTLNLADRDLALTQWRNQATPNITKLLPGCGIELLLPEAYYTACREADKQIRPPSVQAAINFLTHTLGISATELCAWIGGFSDEGSEARIDEYRVGFSLHDDPDVVYGLVWPLYGDEDDDTRAAAIDVTGRANTGNAIVNKTPVEQIIALLQAAGVSRIKQHDERFAMEFCDDCGAPLYPDQSAELVHAEMPEDAPQSPGHLH